MRSLSTTFTGLAIAAAAVGACSGATAPERELAAARGRWENRKPAAYAVTIERSCFCVSGGPVIVLVRGGVVESRTYVANGAAVEPMYADLYPSIDGLFAAIDDARQRGAAAVDVTYDPAIGFPALISIDYDKRMADDEITYRATNFQSR